VEFTDGIPDEIPPRALRWNFAVKFYRWNFKISKNFIDEISLRRKILKRAKF